MSPFPHCVTLFPYTTLFRSESAITVEIRKTGDETYLAQVITLVRQAQESRSRSQDLANRAAVWLTGAALGSGAVTLADRKSTRLNSSHLGISYAVFCLQKKT